MDETFVVKFIINMAQTHPSSLDAISEGPPHIMAALLSIFASSQLLWRPFFKGRASLLALFWNLGEKQCSGAREDLQLLREKEEEWN